MRPLEEILEEYEDLRESFRHFAKTGDNNREALIEFQHKFIDLKADLRPWHTKVLAGAEMRNDKQSTAVKYRISMAMMRDDYPFDDETPLYDTPPTITHAEKYAAASQKYKQFLEQRVFYRESLANIVDVREDLSSFVNLIKDKLK